MDPDQIERIRDATLEASPDYLQDRDETLIVLLADTGLRVGELCALKWEWFDLEARELRLPSSAQKGDPGMAYLDLSRESARQLRRFKNSRYKDTERVFYSRQSDSITERSVQNLVEKLAVAAEVRPYAVDALESHEVTEGRAPPEAVTPHTFRHSIAFRLIRREGKRLEDVQLRLRHANLQTTDQVYSHLRRR